VYSAVWEELLAKRPAWCGDKYYELYYTVVMVSEHNETFFLPKILWGRSPQLELFINLIEGLYKSLYTPD
jgi:hypothetical protein